MNLILFRNPSWWCTLAVLVYAMAGNTSWAQGTGGAGPFTLLHASFNPIPTPWSSAALGSNQFTLSRTQIALPTSAADAQRFSLVASVGSTVILNTPDLPHIRLEPAGADLELRWEDPVVSPGYGLEFTTSLASGLWSPLVPELTPSGRRYRIPKSSQLGVSFFRLKKL